MAGRYQPFILYPNEELIVHEIRNGLDCDCPEDAPFTSDIEIGEYIGNTYYERYGDWKVRAICLRCHQQNAMLIPDGIFRRRSIMDQGEYDYVRRAMIDRGCVHEDHVTVSPWQIESRTGRKVRIAACLICHKRLVYDSWVGPEA